MVCPAEIFNWRSICYLISNHNIFTKVLVIGPKDSILLTHEKKMISKVHFYIDGDSLK